MSKTYNNNIHVPIQTISFRCLPFLCHFSSWRTNDQLKQSEHTKYHFNLTCMSVCFCMRFYCFHFFFLYIFLFFHFMYSCLHLLLIVSILSSAIVFGMRNSIDIYLLLYAFLYFSHQFSFSVMTYVFTIELYVRCGFFLLLLCYSFVSAK